MKKLLLLLIVLAIVAMAGWRLYQYQRGAGPGVPKGKRSAVSVAVETKPIQKGAIQDVGVFMGSLEPKSQFAVAPKVAGWLRELLVDVGDRIERNQVIAVLDDEEFTQEVEQARAELQVTNANAANCASDLDIAKREYERAKTLREKQIASAAALDVSEAAFNACQTRYKVSLAQVAQKEAALKTADVRLSYTKVRAFWEEGSTNLIQSGPSTYRPGQSQGRPLQGDAITFERDGAGTTQPISAGPSQISAARVVGEKFVDEGALLQVNQPIVSILQNNPLTAVVYVIERDYSKVTIGQQAVVTTDAYPGRTFAGGITRIAPLLKESSRQARVEVEVPNLDLLLKPGMFVRARVEFARHENATLIPLPALVRRNDKEGIFIADPKNLKVRFVPVTTGISSGELVEIIAPEISGLAVTMGNHLLEDGSDITMADQSGNSSPTMSGLTEREAPGGARTGSQAPPVNTRSGGSR